MTFYKKLSSIVIFYFFVHLSYGQLVINVKNKGGDIVQEIISTNISKNTVQLEFQKSDGTLITQLIDFNNDVQILRALVLGEEERGQNQYQVMCFVTYFERNDFISTDAMSKLRQKNPGTIRIPEDDRGRQNFQMDYFINLTSASVISGHITPLCTEASNAIYTRNVDLRKWANKPGASELSLMSAVRSFPNLNNQISDNQISAQQPLLLTNNLSSCNNITTVRNVPCQCHFDISIGWYPCGLKYCKGKRNSDRGTYSTYRCGIKTCRKTFSFAYYVAHKHFCLWDE